LSTNKALSLGTDYWARLNIPKTGMAGVT